MKKIQILVFSLLCLALSMQAQTIAVTNTSLEVIAANSTTRAFYDLDKVTITYKSGIVQVFDAAASTQLFSGDTTAVTISGATTWSAKAAKLAVWYISATDLNGKRYFLPRKEVNYIYKASDNTVKAVNDLSKKVLYAGPLDSVTIYSVSGVSNKLTYLRQRAYLDSKRHDLSLPETPTVAVGAAAGTGATATIVGTGTDFKVTLTTGSEGTIGTSGVLFTVTLPNTYPTGVIAQVTAADADAATHTVRYFTTETASTVVLNANSAALSATTAYVLNISAKGY
jgi:hypothetical protein